MQSQHVLLGHKLLQQTLISYLERERTYGIVQQGRPEKLHGMTDVKSKHLSEVCKNRSADGSIKVSRIIGGEYVVAPTADAFLRLRGSLMSAADDEAMD